jgi:hypothetical protein
MATENMKNMPIEYYCEKCDYKCFKIFCWKQHLNTSKHQNATESYIEATSKYVCVCEKQFKHHSSFYRHKKSCIKHLNNEVETIEEPKDTIINTNEISPELIMSVLQQNKELQTMLMEQNKTIMELSKNNSITNNNNNNNTINSHNKTFNLQFFLNETCKNAMNISDFVDSIKLQLSDLENVGKIGYVEGISKIIINNLKALDVTERPVHCSDSKRDTMYVKDEDKWEKENENNEKVLKAIEDIANKNSKMVKEWKQKNPECASSKSHKADVYSHIMIQAVCSNNNTNNNKILKKLAKEVTIDKH